MAGRAIMSPVDGRRDDLSTQYAPAVMVLAMTAPNLEELRIGGTLEDSQAGAPFNAFNRGASLRHA